MIIDSQSVGQENSKITQAGYLMSKLLLLSIFLFPTISVSAPYQELVPKFKGLHSNVMVRKIDTPTLANLDFSAYDRNPVLVDRDKIKLPDNKVNIKVDTLSFGNAILEIKDRLQQTPLTEQEQQSPLAWKPLIKKLWTVVKEDDFQTLSSKVSSFKWDNPEIFQPFQQISTLYLHQTSNSTEFWVKIDFSPWVNFLKNVNDDDQDGFLEIYGKLNPDSLNKDSLPMAIEWIKEHYCKKILSHQEILDWITDLASYWYPTRNTDILDLSIENRWPLKTTPRHIRKELKGLIIDKPLAVIEGKPISPQKPVYNVFITDNKQNPDVSILKETTAISTKILDTSVSQNFMDNQKRFEDELRENGNYETWNTELSSLKSNFKALLDTLPENQMGIEGKDGWLFFVKSLQYILGGDITRQAPEKNPLPHLLSFKNFLDSLNINLLFVAVPNKEEVYFEKLLPDSVTIPRNQYINPFSRKFLHDLQNAGIEVIDLLPHFLKAKSEDSSFTETVYQKQDTHWSYRGLQIAASLIANRIRQYSWYGSYKEKTGYMLSDTSFRRLGDIVDRLPESKQIHYQPVELKAVQVKTSDGVPYKSLNSSAPLMLIGDSFTGVYESVDCKSAGVGAHIAASTGIPVDIITSWGGGPLVRKKAMMARQNDLGNKRLVIYMMSARDLYNYSQNWERFPDD
jgi:alginate O-acetyltransferase complex protein AlgJ